MICAGGCQAWIAQVRGRARAIAVGVGVGMVRNECAPYACLGSARFHDLGQSDDALFFDATFIGANGAGVYPESRQDS